MLWLLDVAQQLLCLPVAVCFWGKPWYGGREQVRIHRLKSGKCLLQSRPWLRGDEHGWLWLWFIDSWRFCGRFSWCTERVGVGSGTVDINMNYDDNNDEDNAYEDNASDSNDNDDNDNEMQERPMPPKRTITSTSSAC